MKKSDSAARRGATKILLVDDNEHGLVARRSVLKDQGYSIELALNGEQALELLSQYQFDLMVTDFKMPGMDGVELIGHAREAHPGLTAILLSGFVEPLGFTEQSTGADAVIAKGPGEVGQLVRTVRRLLANRVPRRPVVRETKPLQVMAKSV